MSESENGKFDGWYEAAEKPQLSAAQIERINKLERVVVTQGHADSIVGDAEILHTSSSAPREMISVPAFRRFLKDTAAENNVSPWDVAHQIRTLGIEDAKQLSEAERRYYERITYVSDVHEGSEDLVTRLEEVVQNAPDKVIFIGDVIGTDQFGELQKLFYDYLTNHSKIALKNPDISDSELLRYSGSKPPEDDFTLRKGFIKLRSYELKLSGKPDDEIDTAISELTDKQITDEIRKYTDFQHYGHYASNLPDAAKQRLAAGLEANSQKLLKVIKRMQAVGSEVHIVEGNWDARAPIDFIPGEPEAISLPKEERLFNPKTFYENSGVPFHDEIAALETGTTLQLLLPFDSIKDFPNLPEEKRAELVNQVAKARAKHKSIVMAAHGEPDWQIHKLPTPNAQAGGEHAEVIAGLAQALNLIKPDELVYGHMHNLLTDEKGQVKDPNIKYVLQLNGDGTVSVQTDPDNFSEDAVVVSYLPWKREAELNVSKIDKKRKITGFGGNREPVKVK